MATGAAPRILPRGDAIAMPPTAAPTWGDIEVVRWRMAGGQSADGTPARRTGSQAQAHGGTTLAAMGGWRGPWRPPGGGEPRPSRTRRAHGAGRRARRPARARPSRPGGAAAVSVMAQPASLAVRAMRAIRAIRAARAAVGVAAALGGAGRGEHGDGDEEREGEAESFHDPHARYGRERAKRDREIAGPRAALVGWQPWRPRPHRTLHCWRSAIW